MTDELTGDYIPSPEEEIIDLHRDSKVIGGVKMMSWSVIELYGLFKLSGLEEFEHLYERVANKAKSYGMAKALKKGTYTDGETLLTAAAVYIVIHIGSEYKNYGALKEFEADFKNLAFQDLIRYFGKDESKPSKRNTNIPEEFRPKDESDMLNYFSKKVSKEQRTPDLKADTSHPLYGKDIVITGNFSTWPFREDLAKIITGFGAHVKSTISRKTGYVIVGSDAGPSKLQKISEAGIPTLTEEDMLNLIDGIK